MKTTDNLNEFLKYMEENHRGNNPLHRNLMSNKEIRLSEKLVKLGLLVKGTSIEDSRIKIYYYDL